MKPRLNKPVLTGVALIGAGVSTQPGDMLEDSVSSTRGLGIKLIGIDGERLPGSEGQVTQDFVMRYTPAFQAPNVKSFATRFKLLAATADTGQAWKKVFSAVMRGVESVVERVGGESPTLRSLGGHPMTHILGETFYTQVPLLHGPYMAKMSLAPPLARINGFGRYAARSHRQAERLARSRGRFLPRERQGMGDARTALYRP